MKLILHFDGRNTIFVADKHSRLNPSQGLNTYISGLVWGNYDENEEISCKEYTLDSNADQRTVKCNHYPGEIVCEEVKFPKIDLPISWKTHPFSPCLKPPDDSKCSIYSLFEKNIVKKPSDRGILRQSLGEFTSTNVGTSFRDLFANHLELLKWPDECQPVEELTIQSSNSNFHYIIPAFFKTLVWLEEHHKGNYLVIIRTHGQELENIFNAIGQFLDLKHPLFQQDCIRKIRLNSEIMKIVRENDDNFFLTNLMGELICQKGCNIYQCFNTLTGIIGVIDDFSYWQENNFSYTGGKPIFFEENQKIRSVQHIIFDDNIRFERNNQKNVIQLIILVEGKEEKCLDFEKMKEYENKLFVQADLLNAIREQDYFIHKIEEVVANNQD